MECIELEGNVTEISLLTLSDKLEKLQQLLAKNRHKGDIFLPDDLFYGQTVSAEDPGRMADVLFRWLGIKHRSLVFHLDANQNQLIAYKHQKNKSNVVLGWHCLEDPLVCAAAVAHAIMHHLLLARAKISLGNHEEDESLTDLATIYAGFGLIILNSFENIKVLGGLGEANFASEFMDYCSEQRIVDNVWQPFLLPRIASEYLSKDTSTSSLRPFIKNRSRHSGSRKRIFVLIAFAALAIIGSIVFLNSTKTKYLSAEMQEKRDNITILKTQYEQCQDIVKRKQQTWDQSDIFIQRQIDADKTRCTSLKNRYNYEVNQYNANL